jgi:hypothetical protein
MNIFHNHPKYEKLVIHSSMRFAETSFLTPTHEKGSFLSKNRHYKIPSQSAFVQPRDLYTPQGLFCSGNAWMDEHKRKADILYPTGYSRWIFYIHLFVLSSTSRVEHFKNIAINQMAYIGHLIDGLVIARM